ncbi:MAG: monovalent cation:proton antiporter-2 (CPA2) family protein [Pseudomonas sp.]|uniref:monovalent cation:proton antiporter-2 (CPA2) family protein n=1 Tax=Pseudomonas sp. TaxID=306 RepID=UPI0030F15109
MGAVPGYLLAGIVIGPSALDLVKSPQNVSHFSEMGVVLLLFIIGLELSPRRLWHMRRALFGIGLLQVLSAALLLGALAVLLEQSWRVATVLGLGLALSSTAFGLQVLAERKELGHPHGRLTVAILLFQDIAAIPLIALVPLLASSAHDGPYAPGLRPLLAVVVGIGLVIVGGRYLLRPAFRWALSAGLRELSTATALLIVLGTTWIMVRIGISPALGAFLAGVLMAESEYRHTLESEIEPFKGLLLGLFFVGVGMAADLQLLVSDPLVVLTLTGVLVVIKFPLLFALGKCAGGLDTAGALSLALVLASGGEFAFVVFKQALDFGLFDSRMYNLLILAITLSMLVVPLLMLTLAGHLRPARLASSKSAEKAPTVTRQSAAKDDD